MGRGGGWGGVRGGDFWRMHLCSVCRLRGGRGLALPQQVQEGFHPKFGAFFWDSMNNQRCFLRATPCFGHHLRNPLPPTHTHTHTNTHPRAGFASKGGWSAQEIVMLAIYDIRDLRLFWPHVSRMDLIWDTTAGGGGYKYLGLEIGGKRGKKGREGGLFLQCCIRRTAGVWVRDRRGPVSQAVHSRRRQSCMKEGAVPRRSAPLGEGAPGPTRRERPGKHGEVQTVGVAKIRPGLLSVARSQLF